MRTKLTALMCAGLIALSGCRAKEVKKPSAPPPPIAQPPAPTEVEVARVVALANLIQNAPHNVSANSRRGALAARVLSVPTPPPAPAIERLSKEEYLNLEATFSGNRVPLTFPSRKPRIGVIGQGVDEYVVDMFMHELAGLGVELVDRKYVEEYRREIQSQIAGEVRTTPGREAQNAGERAAMDYAVWLHPVQDNREKATLQQFELPLWVSPSRWTEYRREVRDYERDYTAYVKSIQDYNVGVDRLLQQLIASYERDYKQYADSVERYNKALLAFLQPVISTLRANEPKFVEFDKAHPARAPHPRFVLKMPEAPKPTPTKPTPPAAPAEPEAYDPIQALLDALKEHGAFVRAPEGQVGIDTNADSMKMDAQLIARTWSDPSQLLPPEQLSDLGTLYRFGVSVRVVHVPTSRAAWFGVAEAQHVDMHMPAVERSIQAICRRMVGWEPLGQVPCKTDDAFAGDDGRSRLCRLELKPARPLSAVRLELLGSSALVDAVRIRSAGGVVEFPLGELVRESGSRTALVPPVATAQEGPPGAAPREAAIGPASVEFVEIVYREPRQGWGDQRPTITLWGR